MINKKVFYIDSKNNLINYRFKNQNYIAKIKHNHLKTYTVLNGEIFRCENLLDKKNIKKILKKVKKYE